MNRKPTAQSAFFNLRSTIALLVYATASYSIVTGAVAFFSPEASSSSASHRTLAFAERVAYERSIEEVYWRHRIWPKERPDPKPPLDAVMAQPQLETKVADYLRKSQALEDYWQLMRYAYADGMFMFADAYRHTNSYGDSNRKTAADSET